MIERRISAMHKRFGICYSRHCEGCMHLIDGYYHGKHYYKCELYGMSHSEASDWRRSYIACGMYNAPQDMGAWVPLMKRINHGPRIEPPLEGQMMLEI